MSVIKQIKLEDINGSLTELADIGAKAENVEFDNSDSGLEATNLQDAIVEITESGITGLKYTIDGDNDTYATIQNAVEDVRIGDRFYGYKNKATGILSHAEGSSTSATGDNSHTEGYNTLASGEASHAEGRNSIASNDYTHAEGNETTASGENSHAEGWETLSSGEESHSEGYQTIAGSYYSHAEGRKTVADHVSHAEGWETTASEESHAEGQTTSAISISHAEGVSTTATDISHVEGRFSMAIGLASHAEGDATTASGQNGHTEGCETITNGDYSHAEGYRTTANTSMSHSEGSFVKADGVASHAEGSSSISNGYASHAEGCETTADGDYSHAQNYYTNAGYHSQTVIGKYNNNKSATLFEVGNGEDADHRSNAFEVYSDGSLSTDNGTTKVKLEDVLTDSDVTVTQTLLSGTKIGSIDVNGISTDLFAPNGGSGSGDMLQSVYDPNGTVADAGGIVEYVGSMGGGIPHYSTMPTDAQLLAMANKTVFETDGYWTQTDGHGGKYLITTNAWLVGGILKITDGTTTKYLVALDNNGNALTTCVDPTRYGVRAIARLNGNLTLENTYATQNSDIMSRITNTHMNATIKFPKGYYVFESPLNFKDRQYSVAGVELPVTRTATLSLADYEVGTVLCFPFLTNGQTAIQTTGNSNIENLAIYGNKNTYHFAIDRTKLATAPNEVITETIAENEGTPIQCKAISKAGGGQINNVFIFNFYTGVTCSGNTFIKNFYARHVHYGINCANDTKMEGIGGFNVHTLIRITGSLCSVLHERVDSCVHALEIVNGSSHTITDVDGDWCTDSLIAIGDGTTYGTVRGVIFDGIHGRCNTLKSYDSTQHTEPVDVRELADTDGYGMIRVYPRVNFTDSRIVANMHGGGNPMDGTSNYLMPDILFTFASNDITELKNLTFVLAKGLYDIDEILRIIQTRMGFTARFDDASGTYFIEGTTVKDSTDPSTDIDFSTLLGGE